MCCDSIAKSQRKLFPHPIDTALSTKCLLLFFDWNCQRIIRLVLSQKIFLIIT